ncbi:hypothetical protein SAMN00790413_03385 [Deinococcus hopiensis KR-140]|uniref:Uncharacterized protein n=1 Tax=Deinococcus hopiensis KR-140 TaxID=695939 RepID=A0A1W1UW53_9DEIO|nr:hypothetical protein SAMN00790413_03385 [Deinococcus hopiensis KR-140]
MGQLLSNHDEALNTQDEGAHRLHAAGDEDAEYSSEDDHVEAAERLIDVEAETRMVYGVPNRDRATLAQTEPQAVVLGDLEGALKSAGHAL